MNALLAHIRRHRPPGAAPTPDGELLAHYHAAGDEPAFAELVRRHGPVVYAACRRLLPDPADADDAFQAVWLVLIRRAARLSDRPTVGPWLYQVAVWTARNLRRRNAHRLAHRSAATDALPDPAPDTADLRLDLDAALAALPEKYRAPVVLCHLHGWSRRDAAAHLGCPEGTLSALLSRALAKLRRRLAGADPTIVLAAAGVALPAAAADAAVRAAGAFRTASLSAAGVSPAVADLTRGVLRMFWLKKLAAAGLVLAAVIGTGVGVDVGSGTAPRATAQDGPGPSKPRTTRPTDPTADDLADQIKKIERQIALLKQQAEMLQKEKTLRDVRDKYDRLRTAARKEAHLEVTVRPADTGPAEIAVTEYGPGGKQVGSVRCSEPEMLQRFLARTHKDPAGPKKLELRLDAKYSARDEKMLRDICQAAGYEDAPIHRLDGAPPAPPELPLEGRPNSPPGELGIDPEGTRRLSKPIVRPGTYTIVAPDGELVRKVVYPLDRAATVADALKLAGWTSEKLNGYRVHFFRSGKELPADWVAIFGKTDGAMNYRLRPGDVIEIRPDEPGKP